MATTAVQKAENQEAREVTVRDLPAVIRQSKQWRAQLEAFLPEGVSLDRVAASVDLALREARMAHKGTGPCALEKCDPASVLLAVAKIQMWGLEIGSTAHLVPFGTTCTPVADYKGLAELMVASGVARLVEAHCVYEKEGFRLKRGTTTEIEHQPIADPKARGALLGAYAIVHVRGGYPLVEYMAASDIDAIRQEKSFQWKKGPLPEWYARKTVIRRVAKYIPKNPRLAKILAEIDAEQVIDVPAGLARAMVTDDVSTDGRTLPDDDAPHRVKALVEGGYDEAPTPPQQHADDPTGHVEDDSGELALQDERPARRGRDAMREG